MVGKRIAFIANTAWSMYNFRLGVLKLLVQRGATVYVLSPHDDYAERFSQFSIHYLRISHLNAQGTSPGRDYLLYRELKHAIKTVSPDMVFTYTIKPNIYGVLAAKSLGIPSVAVVTGLGHGFSKGGWVTSVIRNLYKYVIKHTVSTWFLNNEDLSFFVQERLITVEKTFLLRGEGIDLDYFKRTSAYPATRPVKFLYIGRLLYEKGVEDFVHAIKMLQDQQIDAVGELLGFTDVSNPSAVTRETVESWESRGWIRYLGATDDVRTYLENTHCLVFPSYYSEGVPRCLMEGASMEVPAITTNHIGCREVVNDEETGFLCEPRNVQSLHEKMIRFIQLSTEERVTMGKHAREKARREFSEERVLQAYLDQIHLIRENEQCVAN